MQVRCNNAYVNRISIWMVDGGDCLKSQIFLSENRKSASGLRGTEYFSLARTFRTVWRMDSELIGYNEEDCLTRNP